MRYLTLREVLELYQRVMEIGGGAQGIRDLQALQSSIAQPRMTFGGQELYANVVAKAAALGNSLIKNHPFVDGNKRIGHAAMETFLMLNGYEIRAEVSEQEEVIMKVAACEMGRAELEQWLSTHVVERN